MDPLDLRLEGIGRNSRRSKLGRGRFHGGSRGEEGPACNLLQLNAYIEKWNL